VFKKVSLFEHALIYRITCAKQMAILAPILSAFQLEHKQIEMNNWKIYLKYLKYYFKNIIHYNIYLQNIIVDNMNGCYNDGDDNNWSSIP